MMLIKNNLSSVFLSICALSMLSGCANFLDVKVTRFHSLPNPNLPPKLEANKVDSTQLVKNKPNLPVFNGQHFGMVKAINQIEDLEFKSFARLIASELTHLGLIEGEPHDFLIDFSITTPAHVGERMQPYNIPYSRMSCFRDVYGNPNCLPFTSYQTNYYPVKYTFYTNELNLFVMDAKTNQRIWQGRAEAVSNDAPNVRDLLPYLTRAALTHFPGPSGVSETIRFNLDQK
ncbi:DUF4136 domain-containing protein [Polynucleobacter kasalickyi]|uniref:DUF4136 domain-containing protein n=1 Tax=Polynucleobacter kasalickyi TaxID=1938817 RepID=A0A1W1ZJJ3_9BURK|nr:DUF4136 domain-containing protein [Polynucleobacter kasalickyi]SMC48248.1 protein of unknown function [Polynucleobacter kasalickyi]